MRRPYTYIGTNHLLEVHSGYAVKRVVLAVLFSLTHEKFEFLSVFFNPLFAAGNFVAQKSFFCVIFPLRSVGDLFVWGRRHKGLPFYHESLVAAGFCPGQCGQPAPPQRRLANSGGSTKFHHDGTTYLYLLLRCPCFWFVVVWEKISFKQQLATNRARPLLFPRRFFNSFNITFCAGQV